MSCMSISRATNTTLTTDWNGIVLFGKSEQNGNAIRLAGGIHNFYFLGASLACCTTRKKSAHASCTSGLLKRSRNSWSSVSIPEASLALDGILRS